MLNLFDIDRDSLIVDRGWSTDSRSNEHCDIDRRPFLQYNFATNGRQIFFWCFTRVAENRTVTKIVSSSPFGPGASASQSCRYGRVGVGIRRRQSSPRVHREVSNAWEFR